MRVSVTVVAKWLVLLGVAALLGGCAFGRSYSYSDTPVALQAVTSSGNVAVGVQDARPYVLSGGKAEGFVGLMRGGFGNPFDVRTQSGRPLAVELRDSLIRALNGRGITAEPIIVQPSDTTSSAKGKLAQTKARRLVLVTLKEWKSDTMMSTDMHYDVTLTVFDAAGAQLASNTVKGLDNLGNLGLSPNEGIARASARKLDSLFDNEAVLAALR